jgi:DNA-binding CsgD family transcriptional regulator
MTRSEHMQTSVDHQRHAEIVQKRHRLTIVIVDRSGRVLMDSIEPGNHELRLLLVDDRKFFRGSTHATVLNSIEQCISQNMHHSRISFIDAHRFVRITRLQSEQQHMFAVSIETFRGGDSLSRAVRKYQLTPRELEVLMMILDGASASETASALKIAEATVQGYFKRLLSKTGSRNRPAMVANVLDWHGRRTQRHDSAGA